MKNIFIFIIAMATSSCSMSQDMTEPAKIYYVPIGAETYVPITTDNIEDHYVRHSELSVDSGEFKTLMSLINAAEQGSFDNQIVRVKIILPDSIIYIDNEGGLKLSSSSKKLNSSNLKKVRNLLEKVTEPRKKE